ncbi:MAG: hypothetical protein Q8S73_40505 [Deltaproteobacteria bacterium]|nr:hypothetical protein [Myxococcales bacterium]MDP3220444.1 hypothetical protein [Deltaproteobacteria bacterium]
MSERRPRPRHVADESLLLTHAALVGLTPLIPIPLLDDAVKAAIERRLVRQLAALHGVSLSDDAVSALANDPGDGLLLGVAKGIVTFPFKLIFRKLFIVAEVKRASDEASLCYHRGLLLDLAFASRAVAPVGPKPPAEVRAAVERACAEVSVSPLGRVIGGVFEGSKGALEAVGRDLLARIGAGRRAPTRASVDDAVEAGAAAERRVASLVERLRAAVATVPESHFIALEDRFEAALGVPLDRPATG